MLLLKSLEQSDQDKLVLVVTKLPESSWTTQALAKFEEEQRAQQFLEEAQHLGFDALRAAIDACQAAGVGADAGERKRLHYFSLDHYFSLERHKTEIFEQRVAPFTHRGRHRRPHY